MVNLSVVSNICNKKMENICCHYKALTFVIVIGCIVISCLRRWSWWLKLCFFTGAVSIFVLFDRVVCSRFIRIGEKTCILICLSFHHIFSLFQICIGLITFEKFVIERSSKVGVIFVPFSIEITRSICAVNEITANRYFRLKKVSNFKLTCAVVHCNSS